MEVITENAVIPPPAPKIRCKNCGYTSEVEFAFIPRVKSFTHRRYYYCRTCWNDEADRAQKRNYITLGLMLILGLVAAAMAAGPGGWFFVNLALLSLIGVANTALHESGHALAGHFLGFRVLRVEIGQGREVYKFKVAGVPVVFKHLPLLGGMTYAVHDAEAHYIRDRAVFLGAGAAVNLAVAGLVYIADGGPSWDEMMSWGTGPAIVSILIFTNLLVAVTNLWPRKFQSALGPNSTDGAKLLQLLRLPPGFMVQRRSDEALLESWLAIKDGEYTRSEAAARRGLEWTPVRVELLSVLGVAQLHLRDFMAADKAFADALAGCSKPDKAAMRAVTLNNIACNDLMIGGRDRLEEADRYSQQACELLPEAEYKETRGCVLIELGRYKEGLDLLMKSDHQMSAEARALNQAYQALGNAGLGNVDVARKLFAAARSSGSDHPLLVRLTQKVEVLLPEAKKEKISSSA